jgi:predicted esterase
MDDNPDAVASSGQVDPKPRKTRKPRPKPITVFISHSKRDREFASILDASLRAQGILTFFDERDIHVGHSIPKRMYEGLNVATHLV